MHVFALTVSSKRRQRASLKPWSPCPEEHWLKCIWTHGGACVCALRRKWTLLWSDVTGAKYNINRANVKSLISLSSPGRSSEKGIPLCSQESYELTNIMLWKNFAHSHSWLAVMKPGYTIQFSWRKVSVSLTFFLTFPTLCSETFTIVCIKHHMLQNRHVY